MRRERAVVTGLVVLLLLLWLGFAVHRSPRFPGSLPGTVLAISGAALMVLPSLAYVGVKRIAVLKRRIAVQMPLRRLLEWHVYGGIGGSVLAILHTGHRFESTLGIALTAVMLLTIFSGYIGRHFLGQVSLELREKQALLGQLVAAYNGIARTLAEQPPRVAPVAASLGRWSRLRRRFSVGFGDADQDAMTLGYRAIQLAGSIADLEYAIKTHESLKRRFAAWLTVHIVASVAFYGLLALHIWAFVYFGLRWLE